jgi:hypothetical protein
MEQYLSDWFVEVPIELLPRSRLPADGSNQGRCLEQFL